MDCALFFHELGVDNYLKLTVGWAADNPIRVMGLIVAEHLLPLILGTLILKLGLLYLSTGRRVFFAQQIRMI